MDEAIVARYVNRARSTEVTVLLDPNTPNPLDDSDWFEFVAVRDPRFEAGHRQIEEHEREARLEDERAEGRRVAPILQLEDHGQISYRADARGDARHHAYCGWAAWTPEGAARAGIDPDKAIDALAAALERYTEWSNGYAYTAEVREAQWCEHCGQRIETASKRGARHSGFIGRHYELTGLLEAVGVRESGSTALGAGWKQTQ